MDDLNSLEADVVSFIIEGPTERFHFHQSLLGVACSHSLGQEDLFSIRLVDQTYRTGLSEPEVIGLLQGSKPPTSDRVVSPR